MCPKVNWFVDYKLLFDFKYKFITGVSLLALAKSIHYVECRVPVFLKLSISYEFRLKPSCTPPCDIAIFRLFHEQHGLVKWLWYLGQKMNQGYCKQPLIKVRKISGNTTTNGLNGLSEFPAKEKKTYSEFLWRVAFIIRLANGKRMGLFICNKRCDLRIFYLNSSLLCCFYSSLV